MSSLLNILQGTEAVYAAPAQLQWIRDPAGYTVTLGRPAADAGISVRGAQIGYIDIRPRFQPGRRTFFVTIAAVGHAGVYEVETDTSRDVITSTGTTAALGTPEATARELGLQMQATFDTYGTFTGDPPLLHDVIDVGNGNLDTLLLQHLDLPAAPSDMAITENSDGPVLIYSDALTCSARIWVIRRTAPGLPSDVQCDWVVLEDLGSISPEHGATRSPDVGPFDRLFVELYGITGPNARPYLVVGRSV